MKQGNVDDEMKRVVVKLSELDPCSETYENGVRNLEVLSKVKTSKKGGFWPSSEVIFGGLINIGGILLVLYFERLDVVSSKAFGMIKQQLK